MTLNFHAPAALISALALVAAAPALAQITPGETPMQEQQSGTGAATATDEADTDAEEGEAEYDEEAAADDEPDVEEGDPNLAAAYEEGGIYYTEEDIPTFNVAEDGTVDWLTYSGFRRYHAECHTCHGPDGEGSTYAPAIKNSAVNLDYYDFYHVVVNGRQNGNSVMPAFGSNPNVMCYLDDIYVYLKARGADAVPRGRPADNEPKTDAIQENEDACMG